MKLKILQYTNWANKIMIMKRIKLTYLYGCKFFSPFIIKFFPELLSLILEWPTKHKRLPQLSNRIFYSKDVFDDFLYLNLDVPDFDTVNIIMRGNYNKEYIDTNLPTFFVNPEDINTDVYKIPWLCTSDLEHLQAMLGQINNKFSGRYNFTKPIPILYNAPRAKWNKKLKIQMSLSDIDEKLKNRVCQQAEDIGTHFHANLMLHKFVGPNIQIGSGVLSVLCLLKRSNKVNVYGWDCYLDGDFPTSYRLQIYKLWTTFVADHPGSRFASCLCDWLYAYRFMSEFTEERLVIFGKINKIRKLNWIKGKLFRVFYKSIK